MLRSRFVVAGFAALMLAPGSHAADDFKVEEGFTLLFNGKDLTGWKTAAKGKAGESLDGKTESPTRRFVVKEGVLVIDPKVKGDLTINSEKEFSGDSHLKFDFRPGA